MDYIYKKIKYVALIFFIILFLISIFRQIILFKDNDLGKAEFNLGQVTLLNDDGTKKDIILPAQYSVQHYDGKVVDVLYNDKEAFVIEWNHILRNNLFILMFIGGFTFLILSEKKNKS